MIWKLYSGECKWAIVIHKFHDDSCQYLSLSLGEIVYIRRHCQGWYYGFKATQCSRCGAFPKVCVQIAAPEFWSELNAELHVVFCQLISVFKNGDPTQSDRLSSSVTKVVDLKNSLNNGLTEREVAEGTKTFLTNLALLQKDLDLPIVVRDESYLSVDPYSEILVDLHRKHLNLFNQLEDAKLTSQCPAHKLFSVRLNFDRLPQAEITMYLASQVITGASDFPPNSGTSPTGLANGCSLSEQGGNGNPQCAFTTGTFQLTPTLNRLTENVIIDGYAHMSIEVLFTELDPIQPREERILLMILVNRIGDMHLKRPRTSVKGFGSISKPFPSQVALRRPYGVACLDITRELVPPRGRSYWSEDTRSSTGLMSTTNLNNRTIQIIATGEQFQLDAILQAAKETPVAYWCTAPSNREVVASQTTNSSSVAYANPVTLGFSSLIDSQPTEILEIGLRSVEVVDPIQSKLFTRHTDGPERYHGRRYGFSHLLGVGLHHHQEVYLELVSGYFFKGSKKQERNVEVEISLRDSYGNLPSTPSQNGQPWLFRSTVYYHKNHPRWSELFTLQLPPSTSSQTILDNSTPASLSTNTETALNNPDPVEPSVPGGLAGDHLRFVCRHRSTGSPSKDKIIGVAFLRLQPSTSIPVLLSDGDYYLHVHKMDSHQIDSCAYLRENSYLSGPNGGSSSGGSSMSGSQGSIGIVTIPSSSSSSLSTFTQMKQRHEMLHVRTRVCSNNHTTDENLTKVIFWRRYREDLIMCLRQGIYLSRTDVELRKFTASLIDSLVQILATCADINQPHCNLNINLGYSVLMALARCFQDLLNNQAYKDLVNAYLQAPSFDYPTVYYPYLCLLNSILSDILSSDASCAGDADDDPNRLRCAPLRCSTSLIDNKAVQMIFGRMYWAFRLIVRSRQLELEQMLSSNESPTIESSPFVLQMDLFFSQVIKVVSCSDNESLKSNLLKSVPEILKDISSVYPLTRLASSVVTLVEKTLECSGLRNHKILMETIQSPLFDSLDCRNILLPAVHRSLTTFFSDCLSKELVSGRIETDLRMYFWCDTVLTFVSRMVHTSGIAAIHSATSEVNTSTDADTTLLCSDTPTNQTSPEMFDLLITNGFLRWCMQQLAAVFLFIRNEELNSRSSGLSEDQWTVRHKIPSHREHVCTGGSSNMCPANRAICAANRLQPVLGHLTSSVFTLLQQLDRPSWYALLMPKSEVAEPNDTPSCQCGVCARLQLMDLYDFCHEFLSLLSLMHEYPSYRSPSPHLQPSEFHTHSLVNENHHSRLVDNRSACDGISHFADAWIEMLIAVSNAELQVLQILTDLVIQPICVNPSLRTKLPNFPAVATLRPDHPLAFELINMMQQCLGSFVVNQVHLCTESFPSVIRSRVDRCCSGRAMDMRQVACDRLASLWHSIGDQYKSLYVPTFLPTIVDLTTIPIASMRNTCVDLILDAMRFNPSCVERDLVSEIDRVMQWAGTGFAANLLKLFEARWHTIATKTISSNLDSVSVRHQNLITDLIRHINCLLAYGEFFNHPSKLKEMLALHNLRAVYERNGRTDMVLRYLYRLENLHAEMGNDIERGYTLELISKQYSWSEEPVDRSHIPIRYDRYAAASSRALRERLLRDSLACLKKGTDWERAIDVCSELAELYRSVAPNFSELSSILNEQADLYQRIVSSQYPRIPYHYYLLVVNSPSFASFNADRFVFRTTNDASEVLRTLSEHFPETACLAKAPGVYSIPDHPTIFVSGNLIPQATLPKHLTAHGVDSRIKSYYLHNRVNCFTHIRHMKPTMTKDGREQPSAEETRYFVEDYLPNIVPLVPVTKTETSLLDPVQLANINIQDIIRRLESHIALASEPSNLKGLEQMKGILASSIFSPVSGGLPKLLESLELSDDAGQESNFSQLSNNVLDLLELQFTGLKLWYTMEPPSSQTAQSTESNFLQNTVSSYEMLVRDMSRKFGFYVGHLRATHLKYGPENTNLTIERRSSSSTMSSRQPITASAVKNGNRVLPRPRSAQPANTRVFQRLDSSTLTDFGGATLRLDRSRSGARSSSDHGSHYTNDGSLVNRTCKTIDSNALHLTCEPPPLPERPGALFKPEASDYLLGVNQTDNYIALLPQYGSADLADTSLSSNTVSAVNSSNQTLQSELLSSPAPIRSNSVTRYCTPERPPRRSDDTTAPPVPPRVSGSVR